MQTIGCKKIFFVYKFAYNSYAEKEPGEIRKEND
jgi:hypothetical protein